MTDLLIVPGHLSMVTQTRPHDDDRLTKSAFVFKILQFFTIIGSHATSFWKLRAKQLLLQQSLPNLKCAIILRVYLMHGA